MSITGPKIETTVSGGSLPNVDLSAYVKKTGARMTGRINMGNKRITDLADPTDLQDAATSSFVNRFNAYKVNKLGDTMTGELSMSENKIINLGTPTDNKDAVTKEYVDEQIGDTSLRVIGRFMVWMNEDGVHYVSIRAKKNIDLDEDKTIEIKYDQTFNARPAQIGITDDFTMLENPEKDLKIMRLDRPLQIFFNRPHYIRQPWNLLFSAKPVGNGSNNVAYLAFKNNEDRWIALNIRWNTDSVSLNVLNPSQKTIFSTTIPLDVTILNHFSIEYVEDKLRFWINGEQKDVFMTQDLMNLHGITMNIEQLGILSFYGRNLNKQEIIQHFVQQHVSNFTDHEVLLD